MFLKHFRQVRYRTSDPLHPGMTAFDVRLEGSGTNSITHEGQEYDADEDGWFDLPEPVGDHFRRFPGWHTPEQVDEEVAAGRLRTVAKIQAELPKPRAAKPAAGTSS